MLIVPMKAEFIYVKNLYKNILVLKSLELPELLSQSNLKASGGALEAR